MKRETLFLKLVVFLMGIPILALCVFLVPELARYGFEELYPELPYLQYPFMIGLYAAAVVYYVALYQTFRLLSYIDKNIAFSELSVSALKNIKNCAITISALFAALMPLIYLIAERDDAPGLILIGMIIILASVAIAAFAAVLQKLLRNAIDIKSEHDLTV